MISLKAQLTAALAGTTSQNAASTETLAHGHSLRSVKAELMGMLSRREVMCCKIAKGGKESVVWWITGKLPPTPTQLLNGRAKAKRAVVEV